MNTSDAVLRILSTEGISKYRMAKDLGVQPIMIDNYLHKGTRMSNTTADKFNELYALKIDDAFHSSRWDKDVDTKTPST